jgi:prophage tail gpP-like protein
VATVDTWRDAVGALWQPNALATINAPPQKLVNVNWLVADVTYTRNENGTTAEVTLMPKEAFIPQIEVLLPFDWQTAQALPGGGSANFAPAPR